MSLAKQVKEDFISISKAVYASGYQLKISFDDGHETIVDFEPFLKKSKHPEIRKYLDVEKFKQL